MTNSKDTTPALLKFWEIRNNYDFSKLIAFALQNKHFASEKEAYGALEGLEQWLACHLQPAVTQAPMVMLRGPVALMYEAMVKHNSYEEFCLRFFGSKIIRHSVNVEQLHTLRTQKAVQGMLDRLQLAFGRNCVEILNQWFLERDPQILFFSTTEKSLEETC